MAFTRLAGLTYLQNQYAGLATLTGQLTTDSAAGYGPALDAAFMKYGTTYSDLAVPVVADADVPKVWLLLRYYTLDHFAQRLLSMTSVVVSGVSASFREELKVELKQVNEAMAKIAGTLLLLFEIEVAPSSAGTWEVGNVLIDFLEPADEYA